MDTLIYSIRKLAYGIPLIFGVTFISFFLMVYCGPDKTYDLLSRNPTQEEIDSIRHELGYDQPFLKRYYDFLTEVATFDFGHTESSGEKVTDIMARAIPVSVILQLPGFILGNLLGVVLGLISAFNRGRMTDKLIMTFAVIGMSISFLIVLIAFQYIFCSSFGLNLFPVTGWDTSTLANYAYYVTVPTLATIFVALGYNTRFYRAVLVEEMGRDHVRTARAYGAGPVELMFKHVLKNALIPIITRIVFTLPFLIISGAFLIEYFFSIPGIGYETLSAIVTGDLPLVKAVVVSMAILYVLMLTLVDILYQAVDPRISLK
jgi:peptide/nickel transport system permease protein